MAPSYSPHQDVFQDYLYSPLPTPTSIRLAALIEDDDVADDLDTAVLSLRTVDLNDNPDFECLSYTWGRPITVFATQAERDADPPGSVPVLCDGKVLQVGRNLFDFFGVWQSMLRRTALPPGRQAAAAGMSPPKELWIDALCINQADLEEKSSQVALMGRIYAAARSSVVWLGPEDVFTRPALEIIYKLVDIKPSQLPTELRRDGASAVTKAFGLPAHTSAKWWNVFAFLNRAWFRRAWIVQELALSSKQPRLQCGLLSFPWQAIAHASNIMYLSRLDEELDVWASMEIRGDAMEEPLFYEVADELHPILRWKPRKDEDRHLFISNRLDSGGSTVSFPMTLTMLRGRRAQAEADPESAGQGWAPSLLELLDSNRGMGCQDLRDKLYSILEVAKYEKKSGGTRSHETTNIVPDYRLSIAEVYLQAAWHILLTEGNLNLLSRVGPTFLQGDPEVAIEGLPSWVPNWASTLGYTGMFGLHAFAQSKWSACGSKNWQKPPVEADLLGSHLVVSGRMVDRIEVVAEGSKKTTSFSLSKAAMVAAELPETYAWTGQHRRDVFIRTLIADSTEDLHPAPDFTAAFYKGDWIKSMREASREHVNDMADDEKENDWRRFYTSHSRLFGGFGDSQNDESGAENEPNSDSTAADSQDTKIAQEASTPSVGPLDVSQETVDGAALEHVAVEQRAEEDAMDETEELNGDVEDLEDEADDQGPRSQFDKAWSRVLRDTLGEFRDRTEDTPAASAEPQSIARTTKSTVVAMGKKAFGDGTSSKPSAREYDRLRLRFAHPRRVFRTYGGPSPSPSADCYFGNGPKTVQPGDEIWLLEGGRTPFVLRRAQAEDAAKTDGQEVAGAQGGEIQQKQADRGRRQYIFVGEAYVHGIMHGEFLESRPGVDETIELK